MDSTTIALLFGVLLALATALMWTTGLLRHTPVLIHNAVWIIALMIVGSGLMNYTDSPVWAWAVIGSGIVAFNLGALIPTLARLKVGATVTPRRVSPLVTRRRFCQLLVAYTLGFVFYLQHIASLVGVGTLVTDPTSIRAFKGAEGGYLESLPLPVKLLLYLGPLLFVLALNPWTMAQPIRRDVRLLLVGFLLVSQAALLQRSNIFTCIVWEVGLLVIQPDHVRVLARGSRLTAMASSRDRRRRRRVLILCALLAFGAFQLIGQVLGKTNARPEVVTTVDPILQNSSFTSELIYASSGTAAFGRLVDSRLDEEPPAARSGQQIVGDYNPQTWGRATFSTALKLAPFVRQWSHNAPFTAVPFQTNVYTWFEPWYRDFREFGVILGAFAVGLLCSALFHRRASGARWLLVGSLVIGTTSWAPFANNYGSLIFVELVGLVLLLPKVRDRDRRQSRSTYRTIPIHASAAETASRAVV